MTDRICSKLILVVNKTGSMKYCVSIKKNEVSIYILTYICKYREKKTVQVHSQLLTVTR